VRYVSSFTAKIRAGIAKNISGTHKASFQAMALGQKSFIADMIGHAKERIPAANDE